MLFQTQLFYTKIIAPSRATNHAEFQKNSHGSDPTSSDRLATDEDESEKSVSAAGIAVPLIAAVLIACGVAYFFLVYRKRPRGGRKRRDIVSSGFDAAKGGDELDNLIDKRPINASRNSGRHSTLLPNSAIPGKHKILKLGGLLLDWKLGCLKGRTLNGL